MTCEAQRGELFCGHQCLICCDFLMLKGCKLEGVEFHGTQDEAQPDRLTNQFTQIAPAFPSYGFADSVAHHWISVREHEAG